MKRMELILIVRLRFLFQTLVINAHHLRLPIPHIILACVAASVMTMTTIRVQMIPRYYLTALTLTAAHLVAHLTITTAGRVVAETFNIGLVIEVIGM